MARARHSGSPTWLRAGLKRRAKILILVLLKASGVFALARAWHRKRPRILCYHGIWLADDGFACDSMFMSARTFERRLDFLVKRSFTIISLDRMVDGLARRTPLPDDAVAITVDDGWYSTFAEMLPALKRRDMPATIYCDTGNLAAGSAVPHVAARYLHAIHAGPRRRQREVQDAYERSTVGLDRIAKGRGLQDLLKLLHVDFDHYERLRVFDYMTPQELRQASDAGFDIELHTHTHSLHAFEPRLIEQEVETNREVLSNLTGRAPGSFRHFCYPSGVFEPAARSTLQRLGILSATTLESRLVDFSDDPLFLPRILDGEHMNELEFEAALCGVPDLIRSVFRAAGRQISRLAAALGAASNPYRPTALR